MSRNRWLPITLSGLTLILFACEGSITSVAESDVGSQTDGPAMVVLGSCLVPGAGMISWWPGDGDFDDAALSDDGTPDPNPNHITMMSDPAGLRIGPPFEGGTVALEDGKVRQAFNFTPAINGEAEFLEVPDAVDLRPSNFAIGLWAMRTGEGQNAHDAFGSALISKAVGEAPNTAISYSIWWRGDGRILATVNFGNERHVLGLEGPENLLDEWVHIALTVEGPTVALYIDGTEVETFLEPGGAPVYGDGPIILGSALEAARNVGFPRGFHGMVDEVKLMGHALTATEVEEIYLDAGDKCASGAALDLDIAPSSVNMKSQGVIPVAILGSAGFDVNDVDVTTLAFGPDEAAPAHKVGGHVEDVNEDGIDDLVSHYRTQATGLSPGITEACVTGELSGGEAFSACAPVSVKD